MFFLLRIIACILFSGLCLYFYIDHHNDLTELRMKIPLESKKLKEIQEGIARLQYEVERFENPVHLMELARKPEFSHLKHPLLKDIWIIYPQTHHFEVGDSSSSTSFDSLLSPQLMVEPYKGG